MREKMNKRELGEQRLKDVLGEKALEIINQRLGAISPDFANYIVEFTYGELYARRGLTDKSKELAAVTSLLAQHIFGLPLRSHFIGMINVGWQKEEIIELLIFLMNYLGAPTIVEAFVVLAETLKEVID